MCVWKLTVVRASCEQSNCPLLQDCPFQVMSINDVMQMISLLDSSKQCIGNIDQKFERVTDVHKGVFKDMAQGYGR